MNGTSLNIFQTALTGLRRSTATLEQVGKEISKGNLSTRKLLELRPAALAHKANSKTVKAANENLGSLLDILA